MLALTAFEYLQDLVGERSGIVITADKAYLAETRLATIVAEEGLNSIDALVHFLRANPQSDLHRMVVEAMVTTETSFFRDVSPFNVIRHQILPALIEARSKDKTLSICSAACSSGQEAYSIAMVLCEHFPEIVAAGKIQILAVDLSLSMLNRARAGQYTSLEINRGLPPRLLTRYFSREGVKWRVCSELRSMIEFRQFNLTASDFIEEFDLVLLRNVLMYFEPNKKNEVLDRVYRAIRADGALIIGGTETILSTDLFRREWFEGTSYYQPRRPR